MHRRAFTLPEVLIAVSIFTVVVSIAAGLYVQSFRETRRANTQNQIYEDARFILQRIAEEVRSGMIDYDEYYNQNVVIPLAAAPTGGPALGADNFGQNFGRYYSSFYNTGSDNALGFACNDGGARNRRDASCTPLRRTIDRNTGANPYPGKLGGSSEENAFCGIVRYSQNPIDLATRYPSGCNADSANESVDRLYLISADASQKTIIAREQIGTAAGLGGAPLYALSMLRLRGVDTNRDGVFDSFVCANGFSCRGDQDVGTVPDPADPIDDPACNENTVPGELPRTSGSNATLVYSDLGTDGAGGAECDPASGGFSKDFIPISPLRANISRLDFLITPTEYPHYAFGEDGAQVQPRVTITLTVVPNPNATGVQDNFEPITLVETVSTRIRTPMTAPKLVN